MIFGHDFRFCVPWLAILLAVLQASEAALDEVLLKKKHTKPQP